MKKRLPIAVCFLLPSLAFCCSCISEQSFCELASPTSKIASVRIISTYEVATPTSNILWLDVVVLEALQGSIQHDTMTILASRGTSCDPHFSAFQTGDSLIVRISEELPDGPTNWYKFSFENACRQAFLWLKNGMVSGLIMSDYTVQSYAEFKSAVGTCANFTQTFDKKELERFIYLMPVPAVTEAYVYTSLPLDYQLTVFTPTGQAVFQASVSGERSYPIHVSDYPNGLYFVRLQIGDVIIVRRLVVTH